MPQGLDRRRARVPELGAVRRRIAQTQHLQLLPEAASTCLDCTRATALPWRVPRFPPMSVRRSDEPPNDSLTVKLGSWFEAYATGRGVIAVPIIVLIVALAAAIKLLSPAG